MNVTIGRSDVCMGDAAGCLVLTLRDDATVSDVLLAMLQSDFLPGIGGGLATWLVMGSRPVAVVAQQWTAPRWLISPELPASVAREPVGQYHFWVHYAGQTDPEKMYEEYRDGGSRGPTGKP